MQEEIHSQFLRRGLLPGPGVVEYIMKQNDPERFIQNAFARMSKKKDQFVVTLSDLGMDDDMSQSHAEEKVEPFCSEDTLPLVLKDYAESCMSCGDVNAFSRYFRSRLAKMKKMLPPSNVKISSIRHDMDVRITGLIARIDNGKKPGTKFIEIEDETGSIRVYISSDLKETAEDLLLDEVIHIQGKVPMKRDDHVKISNGSTKRDKPIIFAEQILRPEITLRSPQNNLQGRSAVAFLSDLHVGSKTFLPDAWDRFIKWINGGDPLAKRVKTIIVCGDNVDGIGVYPGQEKDLLIVDIEEQYKTCAELLREIREDVTVVIIPGNHDATRPGEPQPALPMWLRSLFKDKRFIFSGNPSLLLIEGFYILAYHGRGIDDMVSSIRGVSYSNPERAMIEMLRRRHLVPTYGKNTPIYPSEEDSLIIDVVPHIFVTGHVHAARVSEYRGITLINASAWQSQTEYQRTKNFFPNPARVPVYDLAERHVSLLDFSS